MNISKEFAVLFGVLFLPGLLAQGNPVDPAGFNHLSYHLSVLTISIPQLLLVIYVSNLRRPGSGGRFGWVRPAWKDLGIAGMGYLGTLTVALLVSMVAQLILRDPGLLKPQVEWQFNTPALLPVAIVSTLAIGYREEIFYRAYLTDRAAEVGIRPVATVGAGSLLFAAGHIYQGLMGFVVALTVGGFLAVLYIKTKSLHGVAIAHGLYNLTVLLTAGGWISRFG